jgi:predicted alpha/beta hydrolase
MAKRPQLGQSLEIQAEGAQLSARFYSPQRVAKAYLLLHGASGVPQRYYAAFANCASEQGLLPSTIVILGSACIGLCIKAMRISLTG